MVLCGSCVVPNGKLVAFQLCCLKIGLHCACLYLVLLFSVPSFTRILARGIAYRVNIVCPVSKLHVLHIVNCSSVSEHSAFLL